RDEVLGVSGRRKPGVPRHRGTPGFYVVPSDQLGGRPLLPAEDQPHHQQDPIGHGPQEEDHHYAESCADGVLAGLQLDFLLTPKGGGFPRSRRFHGAPTLGGWRFTDRPTARSPRPVTASPAASKDLWQIIRGGSWY